MIDKETWNIKTNYGKMEKLINYDMTVQKHEKHTKKKYKKLLKQSSFFLWIIAF